MRKKCPKRKVELEPKLDPPFIRDEKEDGRLLFDFFISEKKSKESDGYMNIINFQKNNDRPSPCIGNKEKDSGKIIL